MPRYYAKKTNREFPCGNLAQAISDVLHEHMSIRRSAEKNNVTKSRLALYVKKAAANGIQNVCLKPEYSVRQVFTSEMEAALVKYLLNCSAMFYGLTPKATRRLAYEYAIKNKITVPQKWLENELAGPDWLSGFLHRNTELSIRTPESTSLARMSSFNRNTVNLFYDKLQEVMNRYALNPGQIFNLDEVN